MRSEAEIKARIEKWNQVKFSEFHQEPTVANLVATLICELRWVLGDSFDIIRTNGEGVEGLAQKDCIEE